MIFIYLYTQCNIAYGNGMRHLANADVCKVCICQWDQYYSICSLVAIQRSVMGWFCNVECECALNFGYLAGYFHSIWEA